MRYRNFASSVLSAVALMVLSFAVQAEDWQPIDPGELKMKSEQKAPAAQAIYLYRQVDRDDTVSVIKVYNRIKILTEEGRKYADIEIPYEKSNESVRYIQARTIRPDGTIVEYKGTPIDKPIIQGNGRRLLAKTFTLPDVQVGGIIEYRYHYGLNERYVFDSHWVLSDDLFTKQAKFSLVPSEYYRLRYSWPNGLPSGATEPHTVNRRIVMEAYDVPAFVTEDFMPPEGVLKFRVDFIYDSTSNDEKKPEDFWKKFGKQQFKDIKSFTDETRLMTQAVAQIVEPSDTPEKKLRKLYARTQQIRNVSFEREKSEEERKRDTPKEIKDVGDVWKRGYGDATQITWLFLALARAAGIEADPVLIASRDRYFFNQALMNAGQLNFNLVVVKLNGQDLFLDPGIPFTPFGALPWYETAVRGLRLNKDGGTWLDTPISKRTDSRIIRKADLRLNAGTLEGTVTMTYTGLAASRRRLDERNEDDVDKNQFLEDELKRYVPSGVEVKLTNSPDWTSSDQPLIATFDLKVAGWANSAGQQYLLPLGLFAEREKDLFKHSMRVHPLYFSFPYESEDDIVITLPTELRVANMPAAFTSDLKVLSYSMTVDEKDGTLHIKRQLANSLLYLESKFYSQVRDFYQAVRTHDEQQVVLAPKKPNAR